MDNNNNFNDNNNNNDELNNYEGNALVGNTINYVNRYSRKYNGKFDARHVLYTRAGCKQTYTDQLVFAVEEDPRNEFTNPHHDAANLRKYFEHKNMVQFANFDRENGGNLRFVIDVGASDRLINEAAITQILGLKPHCSVGDYLREAKYKGRAFPVNCEQLTLQQFLDADERMEGDGLDDSLYNFTDSMYYITDEEKETLISKVDYGVFACGACHVPKPTEQTDGLLRVADYIFGKVERHGARMQMKVVGNPEFYEHAIVLQDALQYDTFLFWAQETSGSIVLCQVLDRFDFGATVYIRFCLIKARADEVKEHSIAQPLFDIDKLRTCKNVMPIANHDVSVGSVKDRKDLVEINAKDSNDVKNGSVTRIGSDTVAFKAVNDKIIGVKVDRIVTRRDNVIDSIRNWKADMSRRFASVELRNIDADFELPVATYNKVVKELMKAEKIDIKVLKSAIFVAQLNLPSADMNKYLLPVLASALKDAFGMEVRLTSMLETEVAQLLSKVKGGEDVRTKETIFRKLARWVFSSEVEHSDF